MYSSIKKKNFRMQNVFSIKLKTLMKEYDITQKDLADKLSITTATTSSWTSGEIMPRLDKILILCDLFKVDLNSLLGVKDPYNLNDNEKRIISQYRNDPDFKINC